MEEFLQKVYGGTAHAHRKSVLMEFIEYVEGRSAFHEECDRKVSEAFEAAGLHKVK
jgi:hypothetical protein